MVSPWSGDQGGFTSVPHCVCSTIIMLLLLLALFSLHTSSFGSCLIFSLQNGPSLKEKQWHTCNTGLGHPVSDVKKEQKLFLTGGICHPIVAFSSQPQCCVASITLKTKESSRLFRASEKWKLFLRIPSFSTAFQCAGWRRADAHSGPSSPVSPATH